MLETVIVFLMFVWLIGLFTGAGSLVHFILAAALIIFAFRFLTDRRRVI